MTNKFPVGNIQGSPVGWEAEGPCKVYEKQPGRRVHTPTCSPPEYMAGFGWFSDSYLQGSAPFGWKDSEISLRSSSRGVPLGGTLKIPAKYKRNGPDA